MRKGFTLIELLAVIVILAIIALIAMPILIDVIDEAKKGSLKDSAYGIVEAGTIDFTKGLLDGTSEEVTFTYTDGSESSTISGKSLDYKGAKPQTGEVKINNEGKVSMAIYDGKFCAQKGYDDIEVTVTEKPVEECQRPIIPADSSGASIPELTSGMIPVKWSGVEWIKADLNNEIGSNEWYNYDEKIWANAVTVTSANRSTYESAAVGTTIPISDINTMWVWIPRYRYAIPAGTGPREINIVFEENNTTKSTGTAVDTDYLTHPAFTFGTDEVNGIWVGKFETTGTIDSPTILPNISSLRSQTVKAMFDGSKSMENNVTYGFSADNDIHMMKNSEWGAVAYLSHSQYGKASEVWQNNSSLYITGCTGDNARAASFNGCQNGYNTTNGINASTTGNIYGIYDMSGGSSEYVMGIYRPTDGTAITDDSEYEVSISDGSLPDGKYWQRYITTDSTTACSNEICYGDGLYETSDWHNDYSHFVASFRPWFTRGGAYYSNTAVGIFYYNGQSGRDSAPVSFRIVQIKQ